MVSSYTAKYTRIGLGYMGQLVEWPEVVTKGTTPEACREMLEDALHEMMAAYRQQNKESDQLAKAYNVRSHLVHGQVKRRTLKPDPEELAPEAEEYTRKALKRCMGLVMSEYDGPDGFRKDFNDLHKLLLGDSDAKDLRKRAREGFPF